MTGNQLARRAKSVVPKRGRRLFGSLGVFVRGAIEHPKMVGAAFPSSRVTVKAMLTRIDWENTELFVEYGPGVGTFTLPILERLPKKGMLIAVDTNPLFVDYLNETIDDPRFRAVLASAADVEKIVRTAGFDHADYILSGLPFSTLPEGLPDEIAAASYRALKPGGAFMTYQYRKNAGDLTERHFDRTDRETAWVNIPPNQLAWGWKEG